jgi:hypothetical protein
MAMLVISLGIHMSKALLKLLPLIALLLVPSAFAQQGGGQALINWWDVFASDPLSFFGLIVGLFFLILIVLLIYKMIHDSNTDNRWFDLIRNFYDFSMVQAQRSQMIAEEYQRALIRSENAYADSLELMNMILAQRFGVENIRDLRFNEGKNTENPTK